MTSEDTTRDTRALQAARAQRADLHHVLVDLEEAIAGPVPGRVTEWCAEAHDALVEVGATFERHIAVTEGPEGLFDEVIGSEPRLANVVARMRDEHQEIRRSISAALVMLRSLDDTAGPGEAASVRDLVMGLLARLTRHRQHGADLVYEAYATDIGGQG